MKYLKCLLVLLCMATMPLTAAPKKTTSKTAAKTLQARKKRELARRAQSVAALNSFKKLLAEYCKGGKKQVGLARTLVSLYNMKMVPAQRAVAKRQMSMANVSLLSLDRQVNKAKPTPKVVAAKKKKIENIAKKQAQKVASKVEQEVKEKQAEKPQEAAAPKEEVKAVVQEVVKEMPVVIALDLVEKAVEERVQQAVMTEDVASKKLAVTSDADFVRVLTDLMNTKATKENALRLYDDLDLVLMAYGERYGAQHMDLMQRVDAFQDHLSKQYKLTSALPKKLEKMATEVVQQKMPEMVMVAEEVIASKKMAATNVREFKAILARLVSQEPKDPIEAQRMYDDIELVLAMYPFYHKDAADLVARAEDTLTTLSRAYKLVSPAPVMVAPQLETAVADAVKAMYKEEVAEPVHDELLKSAEKLGMPEIRTQEQFEQEARKLIAAPVTEKNAIQQLSGLGIYFDAYGNMYNSNSALLQDMFNRMDAAAALIPAPKAPKKERESTALVPLVLEEPAEAALLEVCKNPNFVAKIMQDPQVQEALPQQREKKELQEMVAEMACVDASQEFWGDLLQQTPA